MWIKIRTPEGPNLSIPIPLSLARSRLLLSIAAKFSSEETVKYLPYMRSMAGDLKDYVRKHGHFTLVDIESSDGSTVKITV